MHTGVKKVYTFSKSVYRQGRANICMGRLFQPRGPATEKNSVTKRQPSSRYFKSESVRRSLLQPTATKKCSSASSVNFRYQAYLCTMQLCLIHCSTIISKSNSVCLHCHCLIETIKPDDLHCLSMTIEEANAGQYSNLSCAIVQFYETRNLEVLGSISQQLRQTLYMLGLTKPAIFLGSANQYQLRLWLMDPRLRFEPLMGRQCLRRT